MSRQRPGERHGDSVGAAAGCELLRWEHRGQPGRGRGRWAATGTLLAQHTGQQERPKTGCCPGRRKDGYSRAAGAKVKPRPKHRRGGRRRRGRGAAPSARCHPAGRAGGCYAAASAAVGPCQVRRQGSCCRSPSATARAQAEAVHRAQATPRAAHLTSGWRHGRNVLETPTVRGRTPCSPCRRASWGPPQARQESQSARWGCSSDAAHH